MRGYNFTILWRQDWFVIDSFNRFIKEPQAYSDPAQFDALVQQGTNYIKNDDIAQLRRVIAQLMQIRIYKSGVDDIMADVNILRG